MMQTTQRVYRSCKVVLVLLSLMGWWGCRDEAPDTAFSMDDMLTTTVDVVDSDDRPVDVSQDWVEDHGEVDGMEHVPDMFNEEGMPLFVPPVEPGRHRAEILDTRRVVPSDGLPAETPPDVSNNNLDIIRFEGRMFLVWRTSEDHFASEKANLHVVSSEDEITWRFEATFDLPNDMREPRFLVVADRLQLYYAELGNSMTSFTPRAMWWVERGDDGTWRTPEQIYKAGFIPWRARVIDGIPHLIGYMGGEHIYEFSGEPLEVELLTTTDGRTLTPLDPNQLVVLRGGASETDFTIGDDGTLYAVARNEAGDESGWGSYLCTAPAAMRTQWQCFNDPRKYDSPLMFWYDGEAYLVGRRNLTESGNFDLMQREDNAVAQSIFNQLDYSNQRKRCSLWRYVQGEQRMAFMLDLPSRGDTCFVSITGGANEGEFILYNYSSAIDGPDHIWRIGQQEPTFIYRHVLRLSTR